MGKIPLLVVAGPTASGKTALGIKLAQKFGGEIISADSMQIYRGIPIATAQPSEEELHAVPHHLIGFLELGTKFSVADYLPLAHEKAEEISKRKKLPIVVGGTGLYIDSLADDVKLNDCGSTEIRKELEEKLKANGAQYMHDMLCAVDEDSAQSFPLPITCRLRTKKQRKYRSARSCRSLSAARGFILILWQMMLSLMTAEVLKFAKSLKKS